MYLGTFAEYTEDLQEEHVLSVYRVWAELYSMRHRISGYFLHIQKLDI